MKVLLLKDVYKLGLAGDVKKVADGYGRNYLIPQGMATLATPGALKQADRIRQSAEAERARLNQELDAVNNQLTGLQLNFPVKAGETGKLYGSVTTQMMSEAIAEATGIQVDKSQIDSEPIRTIGSQEVSVRLTVDLIPTILVVVHDEDLPPESAMKAEEPEAEEQVGTFADLQAELEAAEAEELAEEAAQEDETDEGDGTDVDDLFDRLDLEVPAAVEDPEEGAEQDVE